MRKISFTDCVEFVGEAPKNYVGEKIYVSTGAVNCNEIDQKQIKKVSFDNKPSRANLVVDEGDILFAKMQNTHKVLLVNKKQKEYLYSTGFCAVRAKKQFLSKECLFYLLNSPQFLRQKDKLCSGATQKAITNEALTKLIVNIPEREEQEYVVKNLEKINELIEKRKQQLEKLDWLVKSKFIEMFGHQDKNEKKFIYGTINDVAEIFLGLTHTPNYLNTGVKFISAKNTSNDVLDLSEVKYISRKEYEQAPVGAKPQKGDVLFSRVGSNLGHPVILETDEELCTFVSLGFLRTKGAVLNLYLKYWMRDNYFAEQVKQKVVGGGQPNLNTGWLKEFKIIIPPIALQNKFAQFVEQTDKTKSRIKQSLEKLETLKKALMQKYFG